MTTLIKISPKGQITIPKKAREHLKTKQLLFEYKNEQIILKPVLIQTEEPDTELDNFHRAAESALAFWNNPEDDAAEAFYKTLPDLRK